MAALAFLSPARRTVRVMTSQAIQATFDDLGQPLADVTFCVVDLETTGGSAHRGSKITEFGAVKVRGGEMLGEFQTLVNPGESIPAFITVLTGITDAMVCSAPDIAEVLPSFLEFAHGCVLVAHNAPFDMGFLKHFAHELHIPWPRATVLDTAVLARRVFLREEFPNVKLATLAARLSPVAPDHRALTDARATVDVLHAIFERLGTFGVSTLEEVESFTTKVSAAQRKKAHLADAIPQAPGVYLFRSGRDEVLYVGTSRRLRSRVRSYFTKSETRGRMGEMIGQAERIDTVVCATALEAQVRELRLISAHRPAYNRRSKFPERAVWLKLTDEPWPRLSIVRKVADDAATYVGPFPGRRGAELAQAAIHDLYPIRQCTSRLAIRPKQTACALAEMGHCTSPCDGSATPEAYGSLVAEIRAGLTGDPVALVEHGEARMNTLADDERFEDAAAWRDRTGALVRGIHRAQRLRSITEIPELVAAAPHDDGWEIHVVRYGRLAAAGVMPHGTHPNGWVDALVATAESVPTPVSFTHPAPAALIEETECILRWLDQPGMRMVRGSWSSTIASAARHLDRFAVATTTEF